MTTKHNQVPTGEAHWAAKLTNEIVKFIRDEFARGVSKNALADKYYMSPQNIHNIVTRRTWKHVK